MHIREPSPRRSRFASESRRVPHVLHLKQSICHRFPATSRSILAGVSHARREVATVLHEMGTGEGEGGRGKERASACMRVYVCVCLYVYVVRIAAAGSARVRHVTGKRRWVLDGGTMGQPQCKSLLPSSNAFPSSKIWSGQLLLYTFPHPPSQRRLTSPHPLHGYTTSSWSIDPSGKGLALSSIAIASGASAAMHALLVRCS